MPRLAGFSLIITLIVQVLSVCFHPYGSGSKRAFLARPRASRAAIGMVLMAKPGWVSHDGQPIFSVDVHPDGTRFATAGQDGTIKIWALAPVLEKASEQDESVPRLLATLSGHEGAVNCARWSPDGRLLASGSDDSMVMLWRLAGAGERLGAVPFGGKAATQHEKWRCARLG